MYDAMERREGGERLRLPVRPLERPQPAAARAPGRLGRVGGVRRRRASRARSSTGCGNEDEFRTDHDGGMIGMSFRFFDAETGQWSIYWADSRRPGVLDPPVFGSFSGGIGDLRGRGHVRRAADPRALHVVARARRRRRAGSRPSRPTAARPGRRTGSWTSRAPEDGDERPRRGRRDRAGLRARVQGRPPGAGRRGGRRRAQVVRHRRGRAADPARRSRRWRARAWRRPRGEPRSRGELGFVILHRCGEDFYFLLISTWRNENELWETVWAKAGEASPRSAVAAGRRRTTRRSASGSCARCATSRARGAATCAPARCDRQEGVPQGHLHRARVRPA